MANHHFTFRSVRSILVAVIIVTSSFSSSVAEETASFSFLASQSDLDSVKEIFGDTVQSEQQYQSDKGIVTWLVVGLSTIPTLIDSIIRLHSYFTTSGFIIDIRGEEINIHVNPSIPSGSVFVISTDGAELLSINNPSQVNVLAELLKKK
jgi:hypothetical protein